MKREGYLLIDHRAGPGLTPDQSPGQACCGLGAGTVFESAIAICSHCQRGIMLNPLRARERAYCPNCDHYICDQCEVVRVQVGCRPFKQVMDEICERAIKED